MHSFFNSRNSINFHFMSLFSMVSCNIFTLTFFSNGLKNYLYHWKAIETLMSTMSLHDPFEHLKHKLWPKKGRESNWQFNSRPLKVKNWPDLLACRWCATYRWKTLDKGYNFSLDLISIRGLHMKLWAPKVAGVPTLAISGLPFGSPETKCHLDVDLMERHKIYYKGEGGGFPQVQVVVNLSCRGSS
jgi:hypothetical protein